MKKIIFLCALFIFLLNVQAQQTKVNIPYVKNGKNDQQLDLYTPAERNFVTIMYVHEGSLIGGDKRDEPYERIAQKFQKNGIGFALINYRLAPNKWPSQPDDVCSSFGWLKKNLTEFGGDTSKIFIMGHSSGALLTALVSTDPKYMKKQTLSLNNIAGFISIGTQLRSIPPSISDEKLKDLFEKDVYLKIFGDKETFFDAGPIMHINAEIPKGLFIIAENEQYQPPILEQTEEFINKATGFNLDLNYVVTPDRTHMTNITKMVEENDFVYSLILKFVLNKD